MINLGKGRSQVEPRRGGRCNELKVLVVQGLSRLEEPHRMSQKEGSGGRSRMPRGSYGGTEVIRDNENKGMTMQWSH